MTNISFALLGNFVRGNIFGNKFGIQKDFCCNMQALLAKEFVGIFLVIKNIQ
jgi:hypothetical protein